MEPNRAQHEETIVPVRPGLRTPAAGASAPARTTRPNASKLWVALPAVALVVIAFGVFALLPRWLESPASASESPVTNVPEAPAAPEKPTLSPEELAALEQRADALLAALLTQQKQLADQRAESWGGDTWQRYSELGAAGDDAYLDKDFATAVDSYTEATALGTELLGRSVQIVASAFAAGQEAFAAGNSAVAIDQFDIVLGIDPEHAGARAERARAERLPEVLSLVQRGDAERQAGDLHAAAASYREAIAIDAGWERARSALSDVVRATQDASFESLMSRGFAALAAQDFGAADEHFRGALALRPQSREAQDGRLQAEQGIKLDQIALVEARALAFERRELWDQAIAQYKGVLATDPNLEFALTGLQRSQARAGLDAKLQNLIDNPTLLFSDTVLADSRALLDEASAVEDRGTRLQGQVDQLGRLVTLAATPIAVELRSDQLTEVTLYRVGALGVFAAKQVELRPGTYTAIGSRNGFRDVRQTFTVLPGRALPPITVVCVEPI